MAATLDAPAYHHQPSFFHERVELTPAGDVVRGHLRVAAAIVEAWEADNPHELLLEMAAWESDAAAAAHASEAWRVGWHAKLAQHPALEAALAQAPEVLFAAAGLSVAEQIVMRAWAVLRDDGDPKTALDLAHELGMPESTVRSRLERALERIRAWQPA